MKTFAIDTLGCKVNQYESQQIRELLERLGLEQVETYETEPDLVVINTCCVTISASAKSRQHIRKAQKLRPDAVIVVLGCLPTVQTGELNNLSKKVHLIGHRNNVAEVLSQIVNGKAIVANPQSLQSEQNIVIKAKNSSKIKLKSKSANQAKLGQLTSFKGHTRAFLKIQDGCDGYCSYCIIPKARPNVHSKSAFLALKEAQKLVKAGHKEIVLTGVFLGAYGQKGVRRENWTNRQNDKLPDLLDKMAEIPELARIRLSSLEPADVTLRLLDAFCRHRNIMPHLHLSLQSGSDTILKKMRRQYGIEDFLRAIESIKTRLDRPAITADIIVGFPGETDTDFEATVDLAKQVGFAKMHVFSFSPRAGTAAAAMQGAVNNRVIKGRSQILRDLDAELGYKFRQQFVGEKAVVLLEDSNREYKGRSERYFTVQLEKTEEKLEKNQLITVKLTKNNTNGMTGRIIRG